MSSPRQGGRKPRKTPGKPTGRPPGRSSRTGGPGGSGSKSGRSAGRAAGRPRGRSVDRPGAPSTAAAPSRRNPSRTTTRPAVKDRGLGGTQVEGRHAVRELLLAGTRRCMEIHLSTEVERVDIVADIVALADELRVPLTEVSRTKLDSLSHTDAPQGIVARAAPLPETPIEDLMSPSDGMVPFLVAVDGVTDPGNLGALLRIAECAGVTGVILPKHRAVHVTPTVTKAAAGAVEYLPMALVGGLPAALEILKASNIWTVGLDMAGQTDVHGLGVADSGICLILGAEGTGLSRLVRQRCDIVASIPLYGRLASLNVASAGAVACYEVARLRSAAAQDG